MDSDSADYTREYIGYRADDVDRESSPLLPRASKNTPGTSKILTVYGYFLFICLGIAPQLLQNAMFSQTPIFIRELAEHKAITTHIVAAFMLANTFAVLYLVINSVKPIPDFIAITVVFGISIGCSITCAFVWDKSVSVAGHMVSLPLLILAFIAGAVGNTSVLIFFGFASYYKEIFTSAVSAGFGLSGLLPSILTFVQNTGADLPAVPNFGATIWFLIMAILIVMFSLSFCFILPLTSLQDPDQVQARHERAHAIVDKSNGSISDESIFHYGRPVVSRVIELLVLMSVTSLFTFWLPGAAPFLIESGPSLVWFNSIFLVVPTVGAFMAGLVQIYKAHRILPWVFVVIQIIIFAYIMLMASKSTHDVVYVSEWLIFLLCTIFIILGGYITTMVYLLLRQDAPYKLVQNAQRWAGFAFQVGGTVGILINMFFVHGNLYYDVDSHHGRQHHHNPVAVPLPG